MRVSRASGFSGFERLRGLLLAGAVVLLLVIAGFLGYARYRARSFLTALPGRLGIDIRQETNGFTYSQSVQGKTVFTIHAAKAVQRKDGKVTLHDVGIVLYGRKQDRSDRIYGSEFEYDQAAGTVKAMGEVHLDLEAPAAVNGKRDHAPSASDEAVKEPGGEGRVIHVKTSGLVLLQKLGVAATEQPIEFEYGGMKGHATGAEYSSDTGVLTLESAVQVSGVGKDGPMLLTASRAEMNRGSQKAVLSEAKYVTGGAEGERTGRTIEARHAVVLLGRDGSPERVEAAGEVTLSGAGRGRLVAARADVDLNATGQARTARLYGGVRYVDEEPGRQARGEAAEARVAFGPGSRAERVVMMGEAHALERLRQGAEWSSRELWGSTMEVALGQGPGGQAVLKSARASGGARLLVENAVAAGAKGRARSDALSGDVLDARFETVQGVTRVAGVHGVGHTMLLQRSGDGAEQSSAGDELEVSFAGAGLAAKATGSGAGVGGVGRAVQRGHVVIHRVGASGLEAAEGRSPQSGRPAGAVVTAHDDARAEMAVYEGVSDRLTLTAGAEAVEVESAGSVLRAGSVVLSRGTGDAKAEGNVKVSYVEPGQSEPVHVLAGRAEMAQKTGRATFFGVTGRPARMWQGTSQMEAPVLELDKARKTLRAHGDAAGAVHAVMLGSGVESFRAGAGAAAVSHRPVQVVRITSREMTYSDTGRIANFAGGVTVQDADGTMRADQAEVLLRAATATGAGAESPAASKDRTAVPAGEVASKVQGARGLAGFPGGSVDRVTATGGVEVSQPGRRGSGERLVYTASDGAFVMTGAKGREPTLVDDVRGMVTGVSLRFRAGDDSVVVSGDGGERVRTRTRVRQ